MQASLQIKVGDMTLQCRLAEEGYVIPELKREVKKG